MVVERLDLLDGLKAVHHGHLEVDDDDGHALPSLVIGILDVLDAAVDHLLAVVHEMAEVKQTKVLED